MGLDRAIRAVALTASTYAALAAGVMVHSGLSVAHDVSPLRALVTALALQVPTVLGALILWRRPRIRLGWILLVAGLVTSASSLVSAVSNARMQAALERGVPTADLGTLAAWALLSTGFFPVIYAWPVLAALSFPDERLTRSARVVMTGIAGCTVVIAGLFAVSPTANEPFVQVANAWAVPGLVAWTPAVNVVFALAWLGLLGGIVGGTVLQWRRALRSGGELRLQQLWLAAATALSAVALVTCGLGTALGLIDPRWTDPLLLVVQLAIATTIVVAVTRHGLYGIERLLNRTVVYVVLTLVLGAAYLVLASGLGLLLGAQRPAVTALATAGAAALFLPVRRWVQAQVDRRLAPRTTVARAVIRDLATRMHQDPVPATGVQDTLRVALHDETLVLSLRGGEHWHDVDGTVRPLPPTAGPGRTVTAVPYAGALVAVLDHVDALSYTPDLLRTVVAEAAVALAMVRSVQELERQLDEVRASRARIVQAGFEARRQLERDLHDGAQQRLVALGLHLRRLQGSLTDGARTLAPQLDEAVEQVSEAIADLRSIAAGVRPPQLQDGLLAALQDMAERSPVRIELALAGDRLTPELEDTVYFITCEAVTNAIKHGPPSRVSVHGSHEDGWLRLRVADDGPGGARPEVHRGGVSGMADRARAHGGTLTVDSGPGRGTTVELALPLAAATRAPALS